MKKESKNTYSDISNLKLYNIFKTNNDFKNYYNELKSSNFKKYERNDKIETLKEFIEILCSILEEKFNLSKNSLPRPNIKFNSKNGICGEYYANANTIVLNENYLTPAKFLHEFRHYIQYQLKEPSYEKEVNTPLSEPFYYLQSHEINAYNFEFLFEPFNFAKLDIKQIYSETRMLALLGYLNKEIFEKERGFQKDYNVMCDLMPESDDNGLPIALDDLSYIKYYEFFYDNSPIDCYMCEQNNKKFFRINYKDYEIDFGILSNECKLFSVNKEILRSDFEEFLFQNSDLSPIQRKLQTDYNNIIDIVCNFCNVYDITKLSVNPYTSLMHKKKYEKFLNGINKSYNDNSKDFNIFCNIKPKEDITEDICAEMFGFVSNQASEKDIVEDIEEEFINVEENLEKMQKISVVENSAEEENKEENNISNNFNDKNSIIISDDDPR